jgi:hypothetical protein
MHACSMMARQRRNGCTHQCCDRERRGCRDGERHAAQCRADQIPDRRADEGHNVRRHGEGSDEHLQPQPRQQQAAHAEGPATRGSLRVERSEHVLLGLAACYYFEDRRGAVAIQCPLTYVSTVILAREHGRARRRGRREAHASVTYVVAPPRVDPRVLPASAAESNQQRCCSVRDPVQLNVERATGSTQSRRSTIVHLLVLAPRRATVGAVDAEVATVHRHRTPPTPAAVVGWLHRFLRSAIRAGQCSCHLNERVVWRGAHAWRHKKKMRPGQRTVGADDLSCVRDGPSRG